MYEFKKQLDNAEKKLKGGGGVTDYSDNQLFEKYSEDFFDYNSSGRIPERTCFDFQTLMKIKAQKLAKMNISVTENYSQLFLSVPTGIRYVDDKFIFKRIFKNFRRDILLRSKKNGRKFSKRFNISFYENIIMAKQEKINDTDKFCCNSCGKTHQLKQLEQGCPDCQESSFITDLFPKIISCFNVKNRSVTFNLMIKTALICCLSGMVLGIPFGIVRMISEMSFTFNRNTISDIISNAFSAPIQGAAVGIVAAVFIILVRFIYNNIKYSPITEKINNTKKKIRNFIAEYDKNFCYEYFESKLIYLVQLLIYCDDRENLPVCSLEHSVRKFNIIDSVYNGSFELKNIYANDNICTMEIEISMCDIHDNGKEFYCKDDIFLMKLQKNISKPSDINFEIKKAICPECGESFDGWENKFCPVCGNEYCLENDDWVVKEFRMK